MNIKSLKVHRNPLKCRMLERTENYDTKTNSLFETKIYSKNTKIDIAYPLLQTIKVHFEVAYLFFLKLKMKYFNQD